MEKIIFKCEKCGIEVSINKYKYTENLCRKCKYNKTSMERYGVTNKRKLAEVKEKARQTCLSKYGVENPNQSKEIREKAKKTNLERYGVEYSFQSEEVKEKIKTTNIERYGVENPSFSKEIIERISLKNKKNNYNNFLKRTKNLGFNILTTEEEYLSYDFRATPIKIQCKKCNDIIDFFNIHGTSYLPFCRKCRGMPVGGSYEEDDLFNFISSFYTKEINRNIRIEKYELDIFIPELMIGFEYNGLYWHSELSGGKGKYYHLDKQRFFKEKGIQVFFINTYEWLHKNKIIKSIILAKFGIFDRKVFARKTEIREVDYKTTCKFLEENHIQGKNNSSINIGIFYNDELVSLSTFGKIRYGKKYEYELYRFCNKLGYSVIGGFSKMLSYFEKTYKPKSLITYSDKMFFNNSTYENSGFLRIQDSKPNYFYIKKYSNGFVETRIKFQKHKLPNIVENFNPELTEWENMVVNGYDRIWNCGNRVFVKEYE